MSLRLLRTAGAAALALAVLAAASVALLFHAEAGTPNLSGEWNLQLDGGAIANCKLHITQEGDQLSGTWSCPIFGEGAYTGVVVEELGQTAFTIEGELNDIVFEAEGTLAPDENLANGSWESATLALTGVFNATRKLPATATPTIPGAPTPQPTATSAPGVVGDANCNQYADAIDAALILQLSAALLDALACQGNADVNGDGRVDAIDATLVLQFVAGLLDSLPPASGFPGPIFGY